MTIDELLARRDEVERQYADYMTVLKRVKDESGYCGPHCDDLVLHSPGTCEYCDWPAFEALHLARHQLAITYTDEAPRLDWRPCPATVLRPVETIERWPGNRSL